MKRVVSKGLAHSVILIMYILFTIYVIMSLNDLNLNTNVENIFLIKNISYSIIAASVNILIMVISSYYKFIIYSSKSFKQLIKILIYIIIFLLMIIWTIFLVANFILNNELYMPYTSIVLLSLRFIMHSMLASSIIVVLLHSISIKVKRE